MSRKMGARRDRRESSSEPQTRILCDCESLKFNDEMTDGVAEVRVRKAIEVYTRDPLLLPQKDGSVKSAQVEEVP